MDFDRTGIILGKKNTILVSLTPANSNAAFACNDPRPMHPGETDLPAIEETAPQPRVSVL
jgi:hypothetical protein